MGVRSETIAKHPHLQLAMVIKFIPLDLIIRYYS
ncbi:hypothetical protein J2S17_003577 [Cytobacillus purgationiresistens]|uniref:Uncharacterized protein n=1 Tax=Cytobacillus purgationiresistens TaxID=863449 RepID=A0ABU0AK91_9BACI|nr:hypothetical protein [Cytobacillus purgationiresistens]